MPTIAIVGAGPGLGLALARRFGAGGHDVALISRNPEKLAALVTTLKGDGITAAAFSADAADPASITAALGAARARFGGIDVLEFSPYAAGPESILDPREVTVERMRDALASHTLGAVAAVEAVLPAMRGAGAGTAILTAGIGSIDPVQMLGALNPAQAATRNWALNLHQALAESGVYVAHVAIGVMIGDTAPEGWPHRSPADIADQLWQAHLDRTERELVIT